MVKNPRKTTSLSPIHPLNQPELVQVQEDSHRRPVSVALRRRVHRVVSIEDVWEIVDEWWRTSPIARRYYLATLEDGRTVTIFRDVTSGTWYQQQA